MAQSTLQETPGGPDATWDAPFHSLLNLHVSIISSLLPFYASTLKSWLVKLTNDAVVPDENALPTDLFTPT